ncbi:low molecular weight protein tyrosine phosphatase family protein [Pedosphaera parvula]|uniref:Low molecular weight phosphotyrosine protein phosphatase n=1 Tax=Pedosphaera parvula (strain Ellin514) TaxID=320771 RepID=B9XCE4_PEDPL|nr:hypothetical protein [Pedosphaera parvula]EEF62612.1 low molecular weight phosphotyrosine protein phosphatase [Pedosphaera parvula Ellin514]
MSSKIIIRLNEPVKILFVCSRNRWRSLTAEKTFEGFPGYAVRSAGTEASARIRVTEGHIGWADLIFVMEKRHAQRLRDRFPEALIGKQLICLHISDDYKFMDPELIALLESKMEPYMVVP